MGQEQDQPTARTRRSFLNFLLGTSLAAAAAGALYPILKYLWPAAATIASGGQMLAISEAELPVGKAIYRPFMGNPIVIVRIDEEKIFALSSICTHMGCIVNWDPKKMIMTCPCHGSQFDLKGNVIRGLAASPLNSYRISLKNRKIIIEGT